MLERDAAATKTIVSFLLDRTGSMEAIKAETIGGFNAYLDQLEREVGDVVEFTLLQFDSESIDRLYVGARLADVERLTPETYQPRAYTPLIDACFETIKATEAAVATCGCKSRVIVVFQTDGEENASREHSLAELRELIGRRSAEGWQFAFLGANIDAYATARSFGIAEAAALAYAREQSFAAFAETARLFSGFASGRLDKVAFGEKRRQRHRGTPPKDSPTRRAR